MSRSAVSYHFLLYGLILVYSTQYPFSARAEIRVEDDSGSQVILARPAERIVSLAPHVTELLYVAGAGSHVVGVAAYSDYPDEAKRLPRVGGGGGLDLEAIVSMRPDLIVGWISGNPAWQIERLRNMGYPIYLTEPRHLLDIARHIEHLGMLAGTTPVAQPASRLFHHEYQVLRSRYARNRRLKVFYQILDPSLITVNGEHMIHQIIHFCGGRNIFSGLPILTAVVNMETVWEADPDVIIAGGTEGMWSDWRTRWRAWRHLTAVRNDALYFIHADLIHRHSPRILQGVREVCMALDRARAIP
jgi:iron complex transport system substrate-binding protein